MADFVTGATGFVGMRLCEQLVGRGRAVRAALRPASRSGQKAEALAAMGVETRTVDFTDAEAVADALKGVEIVYHLAWQSNRMSQGGAAQFTGSPAAANLRGMENLMGGALGAGVRRFVFTSTISVYGPDGEGGPLPKRETDTRQDLWSHPNPYFRFYASAKVRAEQMLSAAFPPPDHVILRPSMVYGPNAQFADQFIEGATSGRNAEAASQPVQWIHVDDVVRALLKASEVEEAANRAFNLAGTECKLNHTVIEAVRRLVAAGGRAAALDDLDWAPRVPLYDMRAAERHLHFVPEVSLREGLIEMTSAYLAKHARSA